MDSKRKNNNLKTLEQLKKEKGKTYWARLIAEEKGSNKKIQPTQKSHD
jgi:hypothetical protein